MTAIRFWLAFLILGLIPVLLLNLNSCGGSNGNTPSPPPPSPTPTPSSQGSIQHVVIIFQENRTPDNLFHGLPNADIANSGVNSQGQTIPLQPISLANLYDLGHTHSDFVAMYDNGKMDGGDRVSCKAACPGNPAFYYVNPSDVAPYLQMAQQYTFADRMFQTNQGPSFPAHQFILAGTSAPTATSKLFAAENPTADLAGCAAPSSTTVKMIDPMGNESSVQFPCFEHQTLTDLLEAAGLSWKYYEPLPGFIWSAPDAIQHICGAVGLLCAGSDWTQNVVLQNTRILTDISNGQLATVSWVIPSGLASDHALMNDGSGPSWVASVVNAIGNSAYWSNTVIFIAWDDWGGWYDHVPPPQIVNDGTSWGSGYVYGFRVPLIVVSPYAKPAYVSHVNHDFGSILKFIEKNFGLPSLNYADARADDLSDCFDFKQSPIQFHAISAPVPAAHFLNDKRAPLPPDDD